MIRSIVIVFGIFISQYVFAQNKIGHYVDKRALNEIEAEVEKLTPEQKEALGAFPDSKQLKSKTEKESIMMIAHWHMEHPDVFPVIQKLLEKIGDDYVGDPHAKEFFKYYLNRLGQMNQDSEQEFSAFLQDVRNEWKKLDGQAKDEIEENFYGTAVLVDEKRAELEEFVNSLSPKDQQVIDRFEMDLLDLNDDSSYAENLIRLNGDFQAKAKQSPAIREWINKEDQLSMERFDGGPEGKDFLTFYIQRINQMADGSDQEFQRLIQDVRAKWSQLDEKTKEEWRKYDPPSAEMLEAKKRQKFRSQ